jgi:hypothetical protein
VERFVHASLPLAGTRSYQLSFLASEFPRLHFSWSRGFLLKKISWIAPCLLNPLKVRSNAIPRDRKTMDKPAFVRLFHRMAQPETKLTSPVSLAVDAVLVIGFFLFIYSLVSPHVPSNDRSMIMLWGGAGAACMTGVFWLCVQMFRVVLRAQRADRRK